jgi:hypothetical protein
MIAQKRNRIALDVTAKTLRPRFIVDRKPEKRHGADNLADRAFKRKLAAPHLLARRIPVPPGGKLQTIAV